MCQIRVALAEDIPHVVRLVRQLTPDGKEPDYRGAVEKYTRHIQASPDYYLWVAEHEGRIVGTAMLHLQHKLSYRCGTAAHLEDVVVDAATRGRGIGRRLVEEAIATARRHDCYKIMLTCYEKTVPYYQALGFQVHDVGMRLSLKREYH